MNAQPNPPCPTTHVRPNDNDHSTIADEPKARFSPEDLREGFRVDYGMRTWGILISILARTPPPKLLDHHWVYGADDRFVTLQRSNGPLGGVREGSWAAWAGREVEPYGFDNIFSPNEG